MHNACHVDRLYELLDRSFDDHFYRGEGVRLGSMVMGMGILSDFDFGHSFGACLVTT